MKPEELGAWQALLQEEFEKPYWQTLSERVDTAYAASAVYPPREALFAAFRLTPPEAVRAVILRSCNQTAISRRRTAAI